MLLSKDANALRAPLLPGELGDAVEARGDHRHLLFLFRIGNHLAERAHFFGMLSHRFTSHKTEAICLPLRTYLWNCMFPISLPRRPARAAQ